MWVRGECGITHDLMWRVVNASWVILQRDVASMYVTVKAVWLYAAAMNGRLRSTMVKHNVVRFIFEV